MCGGFYERRVFPWLNDRLTNDPKLIALRHEALQAARGRVLEIGFGSGPNLPHYPDAVTSVTAIEPNPGMRHRAAARLRDARVPVEMIDGVAEAVPFAERSFDTAVSILTLCSVTDPGRVLRELRRVLVDDGRLIVLEHGRAADAGVARWQDRLNGLQRVIACGCNLNRPVVAVVRDAGFGTGALRAFFFEGVPRTHGWITVGTARVERSVETTTDRLSS